VVKSHVRDHPLADDVAEDVPISLDYIHVPRTLGGFDSAPLDAQAEGVESESGCLVDLILLVRPEAVSVPRVVLADGADRLVLPPLPLVVDVATLYLVGCHC